MEPFPTHSTFVETTRGNKVSSTANIYGRKNISIQGKGIIDCDSVIRADLAQITLGKFVIIGPRVIMRPALNSSLAHGGAATYFPIIIGDHVFIGEDSIVQAASIEHYVEIGKNCIIGPRCILRTCCKIADGAVLPPDTVVPSFTLYDGNPAKFSEELPESFAEGCKERSIMHYKKLINSFK